MPDSESNHDLQTQIRYVQANRVMPDPSLMILKFLVVADISRIASNVCNAILRSSGAVGSPTASVALAPRFEIHPIRNIPWSRRGIVIFCAVPK